MLFVFAQCGPEYLALSHDQLTLAVVIRHQQLPHVYLYDVRSFADDAGLVSSCTFSVHGTDVLVDDLRNGCRV